VEVSILRPGISVPAPEITPKIFAHYFVEVATMNSTAIRWQVGFSGSTNYSMVPGQAQNTRKRGLKGKNRGFNTHYLRV
jgi:hypothetical protein